MQASVHDFSRSPDSKSFQICQRTLSRCHEIIFDEPSPSSAVPYSGFSIPFKSRFTRKKIKPRMEPALIGMGLILAGTPSIPGLVEFMVEAVLEQGRGCNFTSVDTEEDLISDVASTSASNSTSDPVTDDDNITDKKEKVEKVDEAERILPSIVDSDLRRAGSLREGRRTVAGACTSTALMHSHNTHKSRLSDNPLGQLTRSPPMSPPSPCQSTPSIPSSFSPFRHSTSAADVLLQRYDLESQSDLLRSHYCQSEVSNLFSYILVQDRAVSRFGFYLHWRVSPSISWWCPNLRE